MTGSNQQHSPIHQWTGSPPTKPPLNYLTTHRRRIPTPNPVHPDHVRAPPTYPPSVSYPRETPPDGAHLAPTHLAHGDSRRTRASRGPGRQLVARLAQQALENTDWRTSRLTQRRHTHGYKGTERRTTRQAVRGLSRKSVPPEVSREQESRMKKNRALGWVLQRDESLPPRPPLLEGTLRRVQRGLG